MNTFKGVVVTDDRDALRLQTSSDALLKLIPLKYTMELRDRIGKSVMIEGTIDENAFLTVHTIVDQ